jgi:arginyl-tRNA synthetase
MTSHDIFAAMRARTVEALRELLPDLPEDAFARVQTEPPRDPAHGDMATNGAMVVAKAARQPPPKLAAALAGKLAALPEVAEAAPAGPGFVNLRLREPVLRAQAPGGAARGRGLRRQRDGAGGAGGRGIRLRQPDRADACRALPRRGGRRRAGAAAAQGRLRRRAGYYINDAGAQVQALATPPTGATCRRSARM